MDLILAQLLSERISAEDALRQASDKTEGTVSKILALCADRFSAEVESEKEDLRPSDKLRSAYDEIGYAVSRLETAVSDFEDEYSNSSK